MSLKDKEKYVEGFDVVFWDYRDNRSQNINNKDVFISEDVKKAIIEDNKCFDIFEELIIKELQEPEYNRLTIKRLLQNYKYNKKEIFGDFEK